MQKPNDRSPTTLALRALAGASALTASLLVGCGDSSSNAADAAAQGTVDAAPVTDAALADAALADAAAFDATPIELDAAVPPGSQRALWYGDFIENSVEEIALYDGTTGISSLAIAGVTVIDDVQEVKPSPDGTQLAVAIEHDGGTSTLYVMNVDGTGTPIPIVDLGDALFEFSNLAWSPDGTQLAYIADGPVNGARRVYSAPADGSAVPVLTSQDPKSANQDANIVAWADNTHVVYRGDLVADAVDNFYVSDITDSPIVPVALVPENLVSDGQEVRDQPGFAGARVYFQSDHEGTFRLYSVDLDGQNLAEESTTSVLMNGAGQAEVGTFQISPDGSQIAFSADAPTQSLYQIYVADIGGVATLQSNVTVDPPAKGDSSGPLFSHTLAWSPDGSQLAVAADWAVNAGDLDNDTAGFLVPASGPAGGVRIWVPPAGSTQDVTLMRFTSDSSTLICLGDLRNNSNSEVYVTTDFTTPDQDVEATLVQAVPVSGDVFEIAIIE